MAYRGGIRPEDRHRLCVGTGGRMGRQGKRDRKVSVPSHEQCICGRKATTEYEGCPSCGAARCELEIQAGLDFNDECGNR